MSFKKLIRFVAGAAIPFVAPAFANSLANLTGIAGIASRAGDIATGAGLGALTARATGGDWRTGALIGGGGVAFGPGPVRLQEGLGQPGISSIFGGPARAGVATPSAIAPTPPAGVAAPTAFAPVESVDAGYFPGTATPSFGQRLATAVSEIPGRVGAQLTDPKRMADMTLRALGMMAGSAVAGDGLTPADRQLLDQMTQDMQQLRETNQQLFQQRAQAAQDLAGEAKYFDPEYYGLQAARKAQTQVARTAAAGLRGLTGEQLAAGRRRAALETARAAGTGFDTGFQQGMRGQVETRRAGISAMPTEAPSMMSGYESLGRAYDTAARRRTEAQKQVGSLFADVFSPDQSKTPRQPT
jgi:hypothetical protein